MTYIPSPPTRIDTQNSTSAVLLANGSYIGTAIDCTQNLIYSITVTAVSDVPSAINGFQVQWSQDGITWTSYIRTESIAGGGIGVLIADQVRARYYRVSYVNGSSPQTNFSIQTLQAIISPTGTVRNLNSTASGTDEATIVRSVTTGLSSATQKYIDGGLDPYGDTPVIISGSQADAFGRGRVTNPTSLFNATFQYSGQSLLFDTVITGSGTAAKTSNESSLTLSTGGTTNTNGVYVQSHRYYRYEPGKSQFIALTGILGAQKANVRSRYGYFDTNDGAYFEMSGSAGASVNIRSSTSGSPVNTSVAQASWNIDKMNGTGISGITLDFSKTQIFIIDLQWLGVGRVRFGFAVNGSLNYCHEIQNANLITVPYMNTAVLPVRAEIFNTGTAASATTMKMVCCSVISEGGEENPQSFFFTAGNGITTIAVTTRRAVLSLQPQLTFNSISNHASIIPIDLNLYSDASIFWELVYNGTLGGSPSFAAVNAANSGTNFDVAGTTVTGGVVLASGFLAASTGPQSRSGLSVEGINSNLRPTISAAGVADTLSVVATSFSGTANCAATLTWEERR